jgi:EpsI family protein
MMGYQRSGWQTWASWVLAAAVLVASGIAYRVLSPRWRGTGQRTVKLPVPLSEFPLSVGGWTGVDSPIPASVQQYMRQNFADDYVSRRYGNQAADAWANVYVVYCSSRPAGIEGHRPGVCYPSSGWIVDSTDPSEFTAITGGKIPCLLHRFHRPLPNYQEVVVLSFYVVNGQIATNERAWSGLMGRAPNISGDPAKYVAQVQISSALETSIRRAASDVADLILDYLPDKNGVVKAAVH